MVPVGRRAAHLGRDAVPARARVPVRARLSARVPAPRLVPARPGAPTRRAFRDSRLRGRRLRDIPPASSPARGVAGAMIRTPVGAPQRRPDPVRIVRVGRSHADARPGPGHRRGAGPRGPDRQAGVGPGLETEASPPLLPLGHVSVAGPDVSGQDRQGGQGRSALGFLENVARVMGPGREFVEFQCSRVAQRAQIGQESLLVVALARRPHSLRLQLDTFPLDTYALRHCSAPVSHNLGLRGRLQRRPP